MDDLIEGFVRLMNQDEVIGPMNIGNPGEFTILELAQKVIELTGSQSQIVCRPMAEPSKKISAVGYHPSESSPRLGAKDSA